MPAPKGNKYALGNPNSGRPRMYATPEDLHVAAQCYFEDVNANPWIKKEVIKSGQLAGEVIDIPHQRPYTKIAFCHYIGMTESAFNMTYAKDEVFLVVVKEIDECIRNQKYEGAAVGAFNANIIARDLGLKDNQDVTTGGEKIQKNIIRIGGHDFVVE